SVFEKLEKTATLEKVTSVRLLHPAGRHRQTPAVSLDFGRRLRKAAPCLVSGERLVVSGNWWLVTRVSHHSANHYSPLTSHQLKRKDVAMRVCLFEDRAEDLDPLTLTRPTFQLLCGRSSLGCKQLRYW